MLLIYYGIDCRESNANSRRTLTAATVNAMEAAILADGGNLAGSSYVMSPKAYELSKALAQVNAVNALWDAGQFNMYNATATPYLVNSTLDAALAVQQLAEL